jgi:dihydroneopterin aldolase
METDGKIFLEDIEIFASHGVHAHEKAGRQRFSVSVRATLDTTDAGVCDDLSLTVDYGELLKTVVATVENSRCNLLEALAKRIADGVLAKFPPIVALEVAIKKFPGDLMAMKFSSVGVAINFLRHG